LLLAEHEERGDPAQRYTETSRTWPFG